MGLDFGQAAYFGRGLLLGDAAYYILLVSDKEIVSRFPDIFISHCKPCYTEVGPFLAQGSNLNKIGRGRLGNFTYQMLKL